MTPRPRALEPLRLQPLLKHALWGGSRLQTELGKEGRGAHDLAESWELCDLPGNQSVVDGGPFHGATIRQLMDEHREALLGRHAASRQLPLLVKFLDANLQLSIQLHPSLPVPMPDGSTRSGKAEAWYVIDAAEDSRMYLGLKEGVTEPEVRRAISDGDFSELLHAFNPRPGDCIFIPPGTVHALGGGILVAEVQQPSDITYRLFDWNRVDANGRSRELHIEVGLANIDFQRGPVHPSVARRLPADAGTEELVATDFFVIQRRQGPAVVSLTEDERMHVLIGIQGSARLGESGPTIRRGETLLLPAIREHTNIHLGDGSTLLDVFLPDNFAAA